MNSSIPERLYEHEILDQFWAQLTWEKLERRIAEALQHPDRAVPLETRCPAVLDLARQMVRRLGESAIQRAGEPVSPQETFTLDQRLVVLRILEAVICEYEAWKQQRMSGGTMPVLRSGFTSLPERMP